MRRRLNFAPVVLTCIFLAALEAVSSGSEVQCYYATIQYEKREYLIKFEQAIAVGSLSSSGIRMTSADEEVVARKIDDLMEKVKGILHLFPEDVHFRIVLLPLADDVRRIYRARYKIDAEYVSFYALNDQTIFMSLEDVNIRVLTHELAHVVIDHAFVVLPSRAVQEDMARSAEFDEGWQNGR